MFAELRWVCCSHHPFPKVRECDNSGWAWREAYKSRYFVLLLTHNDFVRLIKTTQEEEAYRFHQVGKLTSEETMTWQRQISTAFVWENYALLCLELVRLIPVCRKENVDTFENVILHSKLRTMAIWTCNFLKLWKSVSGYLEMKGIILGSQFKLFYTWQKILIVFCSLTQHLVFY